MDPHSTLSQFNQRVPKAGPDSMAIQKRVAKRVKLQTPERPIATNSRIKQDEKYKLDMYLAFLTDALQKKIIGIAGPFDELVSQFNIKRISSDQSTPSFRLWFSALSHVVSRLERTHASLVRAIVNMPWTTLDNATVKSYTIFLGNLLSARPEYLSLVLSKISNGFTYHSSLHALDNVGPEASSSPLTRRVIYDRLHDLLMHLLSLIPTLPSTLQSLLIRNFPHKRQSQVAQATYIRNLLRVSSYCPEAADKILSIIIDRAIQIDVEIQVEIEELEEEENTAQQEDVFEIDPFDKVVGDGDDSSSDSETEAEDVDFSDFSSGSEDGNDDIPNLPTNINHIHDMIKKLDLIMNLIFEHFAQTHASCIPSRLSIPELPPLRSESSTHSSSPPTPLSQVPGILMPSLAPSDCLRSQFNTILSIFDRTILRTFKSRYTQFLVFWFTSLDPEFADLFQGMLVDRALFATDASFSTDNPNGSSDNIASPTTPTVTRAAAASYIGSFVSRATFIDHWTTRHVVNVLCEFLRAHLDVVDEAVRMWGTSSLTHDGGKGGVGRAQNTVFYAVAQAVFLIFCFRWRDLLEDGDGQDDDLEAWKERAGSASVSASMAGKKWMPGLRVLQRVVTSVLNPLRVCSSNVATQFARVAHATDFLYCYSILESNKRSDLKSPKSSQRLASVHPAVLFGDSIAADLNTFFPFDPYRLQRSSSFIQGIYREWSSVAIDDGDTDEDDGGEGDDMDEEPRDVRGVMWNPESDESDDSHSAGDSGLEMGLVQSVHANEKSSALNIPKSSPVQGQGADQATDGLGASLGAMSISPAMPGMNRLETTRAPSA